MAKLVIATHNENKIKEINSIFEELKKEYNSDLDLELLSCKDLEIPEPKETGITFEENALLKARHACEKTNLPVLADDSGLIVDMFVNAPGVLSSRWAGTDNEIPQANMKLLLSQLQDIEDKNRGAKLVCTIAFCFPEKNIEIIKHGEMKGRISHEPKGESGFGYDYVLYLEKYKKTVAELTDDEKNSISHRYVALKEIYPCLVEYLK